MPDNGPFYVVTFHRIDNARSAQEALAMFLVHNRGNGWRPPDEFREVHDWGTGQEWRTEGSVEDEHVVLKGEIEMLLQREDPTAPPPPKPPEPPTQDGPTMLAAFAEVLDAWPRIVGLDTVRKASPMGFAGSALVIQCVTAAWSHQMSFLECEVIRELQVYAPWCTRLRFRVKGRS